MPFTKFTNLDFDQIKTQIKSYLRANSDFNDFDFEGSNFSVLIDTTPPSVPKPQTNTPTNNNNPIWNWVNIPDAILYEVLIDGVVQGTQTQTSFTKNS